MCGIMVLGLERAGQRYRTPAFQHGLSHHKFFVQEGGCFILTGGGVEFHEIANLFPMMQPDELADLVADIKVNGLIEPIILYEDQILDGRNRWLACGEADKYCIRRINIGVSDEYI